MTHSTWRPAAGPGSTPLVRPALGLVLGIVANEWISLPWWGCAGIFVVAGVIVLRRPASRVGGAVVILALAGLGGLLHHRCLRCLPADHIVHYTSDQPVIARLTGTVITDPRVYRQSNPPFDRWSYGTDRTVMLVEAEAIETWTGTARVRGRVHARIKEAALSITAGDRVELFGHLYRPLPPSNPGQFDWAARGRRHGVFAAMTCDLETCVRRGPAERDDRRGSTWIDVRRRVRGLLLGGLVHEGGPERTLLDAMVLGRRGSVDRELNEAFVRTGCAHVLAVSGMHLGILAAIVYWFSGVGLGRTRRTCAMATIVVTLAYAMLVEPRPPIFRAATMTGVYCISLLLHRPRSTLNTIALAALIILCVTPAAVFDPGFQLSFAAVLGIVYLVPLLTETGSQIVRLVGRRRQETRLDGLSDDRPPRPAWMIAVGRLVGSTLAVSVAAWLATWPLVVIHYGRVCLWGWLNSALIAPLVFVVMITSFAKTLIGLAWPGLANAATPAVKLPVAVLAWCVDGLSQLPGVSVAAPQVPVWVILTYYVVVLAWVIRSRCPAAWNRVIERLADTVDRGCARRTKHGAPDVLTLTVLPVGGGATTVLEFPGGGVVVCDAGIPPADRRRTAAITTYLRWRGIRFVTLLLIARPRNGSYDDVLALSDAGRLGPVGITPPFERFSRRDVHSMNWLRCLRQCGHPIACVSAASPPIRVPDGVIEVLWPPPTPPFPLDAGNAGLVLRVRHGSRSVLLCGDVREDAQSWLAHRADIAAGAVLLTHVHGVNRSTPRFLLESGASDVVCRGETRPDPEDPLASTTDGLRAHAFGHSAATRVTVHREHVSVRPVHIARGVSPRRVERWLLGAAAAVCMAAMAFWLWSPPPREGLTMTVLAVGRGTSVVLEMPDGQTVLYDAGASGTYDPGRTIIVPFLRHRRIRHVDGAILSHPNLDHFSGLLSVADAMGLGPVYTSPLFEPLSVPRRPSRALLDGLRQRGLSIHVISAAGPRLRFGDVTLDVLWPPPDPPFDAGPNDSSLVVAIRYAGRRILLTGDIEDTVQQWLIDHADLRADILLLPHHGGIVRTTRAFVDAVAPRHVIRSTSRSRGAEGERLAALLGRRTIHSTADRGAITIVITDDGIRLRGQRGPAAGAVR